MSDVKVSVIVPVYNVEAFLEKCLSSIINQTLLGIEIIIVNDGSTDQSYEIIKRFAEKDSRIVVINQENQGLSGARNSGIQVAKGEFLAFIDSDDYVKKELMEEVYRDIVKQNADIAVYGYDKINKDGLIVATTNFGDNIFEHEEAFQSILSLSISPVAWNKMYKKSIFIECNIYYPLRKIHEDIGTTYKLFWNAKKIISTSKSYYNWLIRDGSITSKVTYKHINDLFDLFDEKKYFLKNIDKFESYCKSYEIGFMKMMNIVFERILTNDPEPKFILHYLIQRINEQKIVNKDNKIYDTMNNFILNFHSIYDKTNQLGHKIKLSDILLKQKRLYILMKLKKYYEKKLKNNLLYALLNKIFPKKTKRREVLKKLLFRDNYGSLKETKINMKPMLEVNRPISQCERELLKTFQNKYKGKRCFIVGNGPSLNKCDLSLLENEYTFGVNGIFYKTEEMGFKPTFYMVEDHHVIDDNLEKINEYSPKFKFFPSLYKEKIRNTDNTYFFSADLGFYRESHPYYCVPRFSRDFSEVSYVGQSVTYMNMQLAYYLGFTEVYLIGMDFLYQIRETDEERGATLISNEDDINHFHPDYFGKGKKWHDPKVERVGWNYEYAKEQFEKDGRKIYNATIGGKLEIFERRGYDSLLRGR